MKAEKKAAEKEAKAKELGEQTESNLQNAQNASALDDETLDPNVRWSQVLTYRTRNVMFPLGRALFIRFCAVFIKTLHWVCNLNILVYNEAIFFNYVFLSQSESLNANLNQAFGSIHTNGLARLESRVPVYASLRQSKLFKISAFNSVMLDGEMRLSR